MATLRERRAGTQAAVMKAAQRLFGERGFAATSVDDIASASRVAKGAIYHYFRTKNDLFEAVFEQASSDLMKEIDRVASAGREGHTRGLESRHTGSPFSPNARKARRARSSCATGQPCSAGNAGARSTRNILAAKFPRALKIAMDAGIIARQPVEPLARLLLGAISEAAAACAGRSDIESVGADYGRAFRSLLDALRRRCCRSSAQRNKRMQKCLLLIAWREPGRGSRLPANRVMDKAAGTASRDGRK